MKQIPTRLQDNRFRFIPLRAKDKIPIERNWQLTSQYTHQNPELLKHIENNGNIGIVCNKGIPLIIDFDNEEIEKKIAPLLPKTFTVRSGRGRLHKYYVCLNAENMKILDDDKNTLCDIQADRKQVVIPPSTHPNGNEYYVLDDSPITTIDMSEIKAFFSDYISKDKISTQVYKTNTAQTIKNSISFERLLKDLGIDVTKNPTMCPRGHTSEGGKCFHYDDTKQVAYCFHCDWGGDIISLIEDIQKLSFPEAIKWLQKNYNINIPIEEKKEEEITTRELAWQTAQELLQTFYFLSYGDKERNTLYIYENGIYVPFGKQRIWKWLEQKLESEATINLKTEVFDNIYSLTLVDNLPEMPAELCCLENGILNVLNRTFEAHTPKKPFFSKIPIKYDANKVCPQITKFLKTVLKPEDERTIQKWIGYCLLRDYRYASLLMLHGNGANGKSTLLNVIKSFLGWKNVASIPMQQLEEDKFSLILLKDKMANIFADLPQEALKGTSMMKGLTGGDNFSADQKFKEYVSFVNYAKFMYSCNALPVIPEDSLAIWRRLLLVEFPNTFPREQQDVQLLKTLTSEDELSGLLNYALEGLNEVIIDNGFENETAKTREAYIRKTDAIGSFVIDCLLKDSKGQVTKEEVYALYVDYCDEQGYDVDFDSVFFKRLKSKIAHTQIHARIDGKRVYCLKGLKIVRKGWSDQNSIIKYKFDNNDNNNNSDLHCNEVKNGQTSRTSEKSPIGEISTGTFVEKNDKNIVPNLINILPNVLKQIKIAFGHIPTFDDIKSYVSIVPNFSEESLEKALNKLKSDGMIYSPKADCFEVVE